MKLLFTTLALLVFLQGTSQEISWSFPPTSLSTNLVSASDAHISTDPNGNVAAVWIENTALVGSYKPLNMPWGSSVTISGSGVSSPKIFLDLDGTVVALWLQNGVVQTATQPVNGTWTAPTALSQTGASYPVLAVDPRGNVAAAWVQGNAIISKVRSRLGSWGAGESISATTPTNLSIAAGGITASSTIALVWQDTTSFGSGIYASTRSVFVPTWTPTQIISQTNNYATNPHVAVDINGNTTALWFAYHLLDQTFNNVTVQSATLPFEQQWSTPAVLSQPVTCNPNSLFATIAYDGSGNALAVWNLSFNGRTFTVQSAVKPVVDSWSLPVNLIPTNLYAYNADTSVSASGDVVTGYMFYNGQALLTQIIDSNISGFANNAWSVPTTISTGNENAFPKVASAVTGNTLNAAAVWIENNGTNNMVVASTGTKPLLSPPQSLTVTQQSNNFGVFTETYNLLSWQASTDPSTNGYLLYRNGQFLGKTGATTLQFADHNQPQNSVTVYGIRAVNKFNVTSPLVTAQ